MTPPASTSRSGSVDARKRRASQLRQASRSRESSLSRAPPRITDLDHLVATDQEIIDWCTQYEELSHKITPEQNRLLGPYQSNLVLKLNDYAVVKFGPLVTPSEAANQRFASNHIDPSLIRVPQVYRYFQDLSIPELHWLGRTGYLIMELIHGTPLSKVPLNDLPLLVEKVAKAVNQFSRLESSQPGPIDGGEPDGNIWAPDYRAYESFQTTDQLEAWFNRALVKEPAVINLHQFNLTFCHLDLARRNILLLTDGSLCLLDWAGAGFYPRLFERWNLHFEGSDRAYAPLLQEKLREYTAEEKATAWLLYRAYYWNMLNALSTKEKAFSHNERVRAANPVPKLDSAPLQLTPMTFEERMRAANLPLE